MATEITFQKASKKKSKLRLALFGASGSGKTYTALRIAQHIGGRTALIDTERGSASKYADQFDFAVLELESFHPNGYIAAINAAVKAGFDNLIIDSLSHAWNGKNGLLEQHGNITARDTRHDSFAAWRDVTPIQNQLLDALTQANIHLIATMRAKSEYVRETDDKGKTKITEVGIQPIQRDGMEYEFDVVGRLDQSNTLVVTKSRCPALAESVIKKPGKEIADTLKAWLSDGSTEAPARQVDTATGEVTEQPEDDGHPLESSRDLTTTSTSGGTRTETTTEPPGNSRPLAETNGGSDSRAATTSTSDPTANADDLLKQYGGYLKTMVSNFEVPYAVPTKKSAEGWIAALQDALKANGTPYIPYADWLASILQATKEKASG